jgi:hypothetical protein
MKVTNVAQKIPSYALIICCHSFPCDWYDIATVIPVKADETAQTLWGDLPDPKEMLEANGFQMRHVVLTPRRKR